VDQVLTWRDWRDNTFIVNITGEALNVSGGQQMH
jgi:hypothetical protein